VVGSDGNSSMDVRHSRFTTDIDELADLVDWPLMAQRSGSWTRHRQAVGAGLSHRVAVRGPVV